jgi:cystathionine beta-lyase
MLFLCHPHNPVGRVWRKKELEQLAGLCVKYGVLIVSDEIHSDLILFGNRHIPLASLGKEVADLTFTCVAPSKTFNLAGLYTSAVITTNPELKKGYDRILDAVHVGGGNLFGQVAFEAAYTHGDTWVDQLLKYLEQNYINLREFLDHSLPGIVVSPLEATYLAWLDLSFLGMDDKQLKRFVVEEARIGLNDGPMFGPGGEQHQRINIATPGKVLQRGLQQLSEAVKKEYI